MCGIVGLFLKEPSLEDQFGALLAGMLATMRDRGPDSAGFALYGAETARVKLTVRDDSPELAEWARSADLAFERRDSHVVLHVPADDSRAASFSGICSDHCWRRPSYGGL